MKVWDVELGNNWSRKTVIAATFEGAYKKAKILANEVPVGCGRGVIEKISLDAEIDK